MGARHLVVVVFALLLAAALFIYNPVTKFSSSRYTYPPYLHFVLLPDGRRISYAEYGDPEGFPVFVLQSFMQARVGHSPELIPLHFKHKIRILVVDRPGYGSSDSAPPGYTSLMFARELDNLATAIGISEYGLVGISAGGIYAMAAAHEIPADRLKVVVLLSPAPPDPNQGDISDECYHPILDPLKSLGFQVPIATRLAMNVVRWYIFFWYPELAFPAEMMDWAFSEQELGHFVREGIWETFCNATLEAFRPGVDGILNDVQQISADWSFQIADLNSKPSKHNILIFHGEKDTLVPVGCAVHYSQKIPHIKKTVIYPHSGHGMMANASVWNDILEHINTHKNE